MTPKNGSNSSRTCNQIDLKITLIDLKNRPRKISGAFRVIRVIIMVPGMHWEASLKVAVATLHLPQRRPNMASAGRPADTCRPGVRTKPSVACVPGSCVHTPCVSICVRWLSRFCFMLSKPRLGPGGTFGTSICWHLAGRAPLEVSRPTLDRAARLRPPCAYFRLMSPLLPMCPPLATAFPGPIVIITQEPRLSPGVAEEVQAGLRAQQLDGLWPPGEQPLLAAFSRQVAARHYLAQAPAPLQHRIARFTVFRAHTPAHFFAIYSTVGGRPGCGAPLMRWLQPHFRLPQNWAMSPASSWATLTRIRYLPKLRLL